MRIKMHIIILIGLVLTTLALVRPVAGQSPTSNLAQVQVDLWPDYDQPALLVLITAELPSTASLPATFELNLPPEAGEPTAVAQITSDGSMLNTPFDFQRGEVTNTLRVETAELGVRVEYYFPYERDGNAVRFTYNWLGGVAVDDLAIVLQRPPQATSFDVGVEFEDIGTQTDGLHDYRWQIGRLDADQVRSAQVSYEGPPPTASPTELPLDQAPAASASSDGMSAWLPVVTAIVGLVIGAGASWYVLSRRRSPARLGRQRPRPRAARVAYCSQCGAQVKPGDQFCRQCGSQVG